MRSEEIRASGQLATRTLADTVSHVEQVHRAVAGRTFAFTAPASLPARVIHDVIATGVYTLIRGDGPGCRRSRQRTCRCYRGFSLSGRVDSPEQPGIGGAECDLGR